MNLDKISQTVDLRMGCRFLSRLILFCTGRKSSEDISTVYNRFALNSPAMLHVTSISHIKLRAITKRDHTPQQLLVTKQINVTGMQNKRQKGLSSWKFYLIN